jgi:hypothetical protein
MGIVDIRNSNYGYPQFRLNVNFACHKNEVLNQLIAVSTRIQKAKSIKNFMKKVS